MAAYYSVGTYLGKVTRQELGSSKNKGTPQFSLGVTIEFGLDRGEQIPLEQNHERFVYLYLSEAAMEITLKALKALGFKGTSIKFLDPNVPGYQDLTGTEVELYCKHEIYEGETNEKWSISTPRESKPMAPDTIRKVDALYGKALKAQAAELSAGKPDAKADLQTAAAESGGDDIPF